MAKRQAAARRRQICVRVTEQMDVFLEREAMKLTARDPARREVTASDVVRLAIVRHMMRPADAMDEVLPPNLPCNVAIAGDRSACVTCGLAWDTGDPEPPACAQTGLKL